MAKKTRDKKTQHLLDAAKDVLSRACGGDFLKLESAVEALEVDETTRILRRIMTAISEKKLFSYFRDFSVVDDVAPVRDALQSAIEAWNEKHPEGDDDE